MDEMLSVKLSNLYVLLQTCRRSMQTLHWYVRGLQFDYYHNVVTSDLIDSISTDVDDVAEYMLRYFVVIPTPIEELAISTKEKYPTYKSEEVDVETVAERIEAITGRIFEDVCSLRNSIDDTKYRDLSVFVDSLVDKYSKEYRFFAKSRLK